MSSLPVGEGGGGGVGKFEPKVSSIFQRNTRFELKTWRCLKAKSSFLRAHGSEVPGNAGELLNLQIRSTHNQFT